ncbi:MAG: hypothetical protein E4G74_02225 [Erysipelotrichales bacterium]|nr:MAG: hypothetical protein E4G74_02225 [Erysipelotrichales bacterium]
MCWTFMPKSFIGNDEFKIGLGLDRNIEHTPRLDGDRGPAILVYAVAELIQNGQRTKTFTWMTVADINKVRDRSPAVKFAKSQGFATPWDTDEAEMQKKTVIKRICKMLPLSMEDMRRINVDSVTKRNHLATDMLEEQDDEHERQVEAEVVPDAKAKIEPAKAATPPAPEQKQQKAEDAPKMASAKQMEKFLTRARENVVAEYIEKHHGEELRREASLARLEAILIEAMEHRDEQSIAQTGATTGAPGGNGATTGAPGGTGAASQAPDRDFD